MTINIVQEIHPPYSKIKISQASRKPNSYTDSRYFYSKYSRFTLKALKRNNFQDFLDSMLELEGIDENNVHSVEVGFYPLRKKAGVGIAGKCNPLTGKICIYPKTRNFCNAFRAKYGKNLLIIYVGNRARASLIHELLHVKYTSDEQKVRALTKTYFSRYLRTTKRTGSLGSLSIYNLIFGREKASAFQ